MTKIHESNLTNAFFGKRKVLLFGLLLGFCSMMAQKPFGFGIEIGTTGSLFAISNEWNNYFDTKMRIGTAIGAIGNFPLGDGSKLRPQPKCQPPSHLPAQRCHDGQYLGTFA